MNAKTIGLGLVIVSLLALLNGAGCEGNTAAERFFKTGKGRFLSPEKPILQPEEAQVNWIIQSMGELDKTEELYPNASRPGPEDWIYVDSDYVIGATDMLGISIQDLYYEGVETTLQREVSNSGFIDLPLLRDRIKAEGMTSLQLTQAIEKAYSPAVIKDIPIVTVTLLIRRKQTFSILGSVMRPGAYQLTRPDMRLLEAMALSGGVSQPNIEYIYLIRSAPAMRQSEQEALKKAQAATLAKPFAKPFVKEPAETPAQAPLPAKPKDKQLKDIDDLMKSAVSGPMQLEDLRADASEVYQYSEAATGAAPASPPQANPAPPTPKKTLRWVYRNGEWVQEEVKEQAPSVPQAPPAAPPPAPVIKTPEAPRRPRPRVTPREPVVRATPRTHALPALPPETPKAKPEVEDPFGWAKAEKQDMVRIIAINLKKLEQGDYRQNIVIRENDIIQIPSLEIGEFFVMGEVLRPGAYSLTGRKVTVKMALASAGNLGPLAWPNNSVLIRRIGKNQEQTIPIHIESIIRGTEPDIYLKPNDIIAVGTHWSTSFLAVMRNAFRMTYGFGFIYDRNFADPLFSYPNSRRFKGW